MPFSGYNFITLTDFIAEVSDIMDDPGAVYWKTQEIMYATYEALLYWGLGTSFWRTRGKFQTTPASASAATAFSSTYDLSVMFPTLRTRLYTYDRLMREIQYMLLEAPTGLSGGSMSGQVSPASIILALQDARNRFVLDAHLPVNTTLADPNTTNQDGMYQLGSTKVYLHRLVWQDPNGMFTPLWRQDAWAADSGLPNWTDNPDVPQMYSEAENAPLQVQLIPPPIRQGTLYSYTVDTIGASVMITPTATLGIPDEFAAAVKYGALSQILSSVGQISDPIRAEYAEKRYLQYVDMARNAQSIIRVMLNNQPLPLDTITALDLGYPGWMNQYGPPDVAGAMYDILVLAPGQVDNVYGISVDMVQAAPLPAMNEFLPIGEESIDNLKDYVQHILPFKCGGRDFTTTISGYDSYMRQIDGRKAINKAKIQYLEPLFSVPQQEWALRPDKVNTRA